MRPPASAPTNDADLEVVGVASGSAAIGLGEPRNRAAVLVELRGFEFRDRQHQPQPGPFEPPLVLRERRNA